MSGDRIDGMARMNRKGQNVYLAGHLSRVLADLVKVMPPTRQDLIEHRWDNFLNGKDGLAYTGRFLATRVAEGKPDHKVAILDDPADYARSLIAFLDDDANWPSDG